MGCQGLGLEGGPEAGRILTLTASETLAVQPQNIRAHVQLQNHKTTASVQGFFLQSDDLADLLLLGHLLGGGDGLVDIDVMLPMQQVPGGGVAGDVGEDLAEEAGFARPFAAVRLPARALPPLRGPSLGRFSSQRRSGTSTGLGRSSSPSSSSGASSPQEMPVQ